MSISYLFQDMSSQIWVSQANRVETKHGVNKPQGETVSPTETPWETALSMLTQVPV